MVNVRCNSPYRIQWAVANLLQAPTLCSVFYTCSLSHLPELNVVKTPPTPEPVRYFI